MSATTPNFQSTQPHGAPDLMRASEFRRYLDEMGGEPGEAANSRLTSLSPSLLQDLLRFEQGGQQSELLEVLAAGMRHTQALAIHLQAGDQVVTLTVFPVNRLAHCPILMEDFLGGALDTLKVMQVEPALLRPPGDRERALVSEAQLYAPLGSVLWLMALRGSRNELLPELAGQAAYRVAPGVSLRGLPMSVEIHSTVAYLRRHTANLRDVAAQPGMDRNRAIRLLNALYLQAGLIISRTHPAATNEVWFGYR